MGKQAEQWLERYRAEFPNYKNAATRAEELIADSFRGRPLDIHVVSARAKDPDSVSEKIQRRSYGIPSRQFDDLIGVRVVTLYDHSVPLVAARLRSMFDVDELRSANKSAKLKSREVGYRSQHLVMKLGKSGLPPVSTILGGTFVEVQIRSVVAHAWAEIEHSLRYKAGIELPSDLSRRFDALAGTLELVDREFSSIEDELVEMIRDLSKRFEANNDLIQEITPISLLAILSARRPAMHRLGPKQLVLPMEQSYQLTKVALSAGFSTIQEINDMLLENRVQHVVREYVLMLGPGVDPQTASATVVMGALIGIKNRTVFNGFRAFQQDPALVAAINQRPR